MLAAIVNTMIPSELSSRAALPLAYSSSRIESGERRGEGGDRKVVTAKALNANAVGPFTLPWILSSRQNAQIGTI